MIKRLISLLWILHSVQDGVSQYFICPYENGLYYATSPDCLIYYRCQNRMLWSGVCFPWQRFDMHSMSCRYVENVDCNPEYAGIWRPLYGESNVINQEVEETTQVMADEGIQGASEEETVMPSNEGAEDITEEAQKETINNEAEEEEIEEAAAGGTIANEAQGEEIQEEPAGDIAGNEGEEVGNQETSQAEERAIENEALQGKEVQAKDEAVLNEENQEAIVQEKNLDVGDDLNKDQPERHEEDIIQGNRLIDKQEENKITADDEEGKGAIDGENNNESLNNKENKEMQNDEVQQGERTIDDEKNEQENEQEDQQLAKIGAQLDDEKNKRAVNDIALDSKFLKKLFKNIPVGRESVIPDLMQPIVTSVFIEESTTETKGVSDKVEANCQLSTTYADIEPFVESTTHVETKQEDSSGKFWYWCGSGRFVMTRTPQDPNTICQQLEDPQFIDQEGSGTGTQDWGGHTFLGSDTSFSKRHTL